MQGRKRVVASRAGGHQFGDGARYVVEQPAAVVLGHRPLGARAQRAARRAGVRREERHRLGEGVERLALHAQGGLVARRQDLGVADPLLQRRADRHVGAGDHVFPAVGDVEVRIDGGREVEAAEKGGLLLGRRREVQCGRKAVVARLVTFQRAPRHPFVDVLVALDAVERSGVVDRAAQRVAVVRSGFPAFFHAPRTGHAAVVLPRVARVGAGVEVVRADVHRQQVGLPAPLESLADVEELALQVGLEAGLEVAAALLALDLHQSARQVAVFDRGDALHDLHRGDFVRGERAHVDSGVERYGNAVVARHAARQGASVLHRRVVRERPPVHDERDAQRRGGVVGVGGGRFAQADVVRCREGRIRRPSAGEQFEQVLEARRLEVLHRLAADVHGRDGSPDFGGRDDHVADFRRYGPEPYDPVDRASGRDGERRALRGVSDVGDRDLVASGGEREAAFAGRVGHGGVRRLSRIGNGLQRHGGVLKRIFQRIGYLERDSRVIGRASLRSGGEGQEEARKDQ